MEKVKQLEASKQGDELLTEDEFTDIVKPDLRMMCVLTPLPSPDDRNPLSQPILPPACTHTSTMRYQV
jgi:hypothetical protein